MRTQVGASEASLDTLHTRLLQTEAALRQEQAALAAARSQPAYRQPTSVSAAQPAAAPATHNTTGASGTGSGEGEREHEHEGGDDD